MATTRFTYTYHLDEKMWVSFLFADTNNVNISLRKWGKPTSCASVSIFSYLSSEAVIQRFSPKQLTSLPRYFTYYKALLWVLVKILLSHQRHFHKWFHLWLWACPYLVYLVWIALHPFHKSKGKIIWCRQLNEKVNIFIFKSKIRAS